MKKQLPAAADEPTIPLRIIVRRPPEGVHFVMQRGATAEHDLVPPTAISGDSITFDLTLRIGAPARGIPVRFLGPFAQGTPDARFIYINSGQLAGEAGTPWSRRAKVWLTGITKDQVDTAIAKGLVLEAEIEGTARDGGPVCASTHPLGDGWRLARARFGK